MKQHWRSNSSFINFVRHIRQLLWAPSFLHCFVLSLVGDGGKIVIFAIFAKFAAFANFYGPPLLLCALPRWRLWQNCHFRHICQIHRFPPHCFVRRWRLLWAPSLLCALPRWRLWQNCHFRHICQIRRFRQLLWAPFTALCFASLAIVAKLSFSPYLPNSPLSPTVMGPLYCFVLCLVGDCGKIVIFAIFAKFAAFANFYGARILLCAPTFMPRCFVLCVVGDGGKIVIFAIFAKFAVFTNFYGAPLLLCALRRWRLWQNCHFRHICQIRRFRQLLWGPYTALCFASLAIVAKLSFSPYLPNSPFSPTFMGPLYCFVLCLVGDCGKIVIFAIFAKFAVFANFYGAPLLLCALRRWRLWQNCHFRHICQIRRFRQLLWGPYTALCFASLAIVAKLSFSPYLPNSPLSPTVMGPLYCFVLCLVGDCGKIVIFAIFAKFAVFANFYGAPLLLCALPRWRLWQNCHFRHICQIRRFRQLLWGPFTALCFASLAIVAKLSFSPYLPNSPLSPTFMGPLYCFVLCLVGDCGKIVIFAIFAKFAAFANFYGAPLLLCALPRWRLWQNCHFRHVCQIRRFRQLLWGPFTALCFASLAIVAKLSFSPYLPNSPLSPTFMGPFTALCFASLAIVAKLSFSPYLPNSPLSPTFMGPLSLLCALPRWRLWQNCHFRHICQIRRNFYANFYGPPLLLCALPRWRLWQNCYFRHICQIRRFRQLLWGPFTALCFASLAIVAKLSFSPYLPNSPLSPTFMGPLILLCALPRWRLWQNCHFRHICQIRRFRQLLWGPFTALCFASLAIVAKLLFSPYLPNSPFSPTFMGPLYCFVLCLVGDCGKIVIFAMFAKFAAFANFYGAPLLLCALPRPTFMGPVYCIFAMFAKFAAFANFYGPFTALCFASLAIVAKLSFSPYLPNSPLSPTFMGPFHCFLFFLVGDCGKNIVIFAIFAKFAAFANFYGAHSLLCVLPRQRLWQNCHFRHICQIRRFRQLLWAPFTALCFASLAIVAKLLFSPYLPNSPFSPTFMGPLYCFVLCVVGDCGKIVIFAIFAKFAAFANFYGARILLCALPRWRLWQNCHFRHVCQIRRFRQLLWGPFTALCFASLAIVAKLLFSPYLPNSPLSPTFMGPFHCFLFFLVGDCGKNIVIFAIFAKFAAFANFYGAPSLPCVLPRQRLWQNCHFCHICQIRRFRQLLWGPYAALCFASLAIVAKLSFSPYLPNSLLSPTFMGPLHCFVLCLVGDCGKIVIFAIFAKFAVFANFYGAPLLLCALRRWRLWQNCHFRNICQIRRFRQLLWGPYTALCFASLAIVAKLSFSPCLPNSPLSPTFMGPLYCFVLCLVGDCGKIVIFAIFAKFAAFANFYGPLSLLSLFPRWRLWQKYCHFRHICQIRRFRQLLWGPFTALCFASSAIVAKLSFLPYLPNSPFSPTFMGPLCCFVLCLVGDCGKIVIFAIFAKFAAFANFYGAPSLLCALPRWRLWQNCHFCHICQIRQHYLFFAIFVVVCISGHISLGKGWPNDTISMQR